MTEKELARGNSTRILRNTFECYLSGRSVKGRNLHFGCSLHKRNIFSCYDTMDTDRLHSFYLINRPRMTTKGNQMEQYQNRRRLQKPCHPFVYLFSMVLRRITGGVVDNRDSSSAKKKREKSGKNHKMLSNVI